MKQILWNGQDLSEIVEKITWSGDTKQVARKVTFSVVTKATDPYIPKVTINEGDLITLVDGGTTLFGGPVFDIDVTATGAVKTYTAIDMMFFVNKSDICRVFDDTPEAITAAICTELEIPFGGAAATGLKVYMPCLGKKAYAAIMMAYTAASRQNGKKYIPMIRDLNKLTVIERGTDSGVVLSGDYNLTDASYKSSLQNMVTRVLVTDKNGNVLNKVDGETRFGIVQQKYQVEDGVDRMSAARSLLKAVEQSGSVTAVSDVRAISGYALAVQEPVTGLYGRFYIESDTHTFANGQEEMKLTLAFENMMDEMEIEKPKK